MKRLWRQGKNKSLTHEKTIALAGNPNVGKSTVFNELTGLKQHTGNWPGKTVSNASGYFSHEKTNYLTYDLPGTYSLIAHSKEEECARDFICFEKHDGICVVCDAVCLERNLNLVLQTMELTKHVIVVVNLLDEAKKKHIEVDLEQLSKRLQVPVIGTSAREGIGLNELVEEIDKIGNQEEIGYEIRYEEAIEKAIAKVEPVLKEHLPEYLSSRFLALKLIEGDKSLIASLEGNTNFRLEEHEDIKEVIQIARKELKEDGLLHFNLKTRIVKTIVEKGEEIAKEVVTFQNENYAKKDRKIDKILTNKITGIPIMLCLLFLIFWITMIGANYPSDMLFRLFSWLETYVRQFFEILNSPTWLSGMLVDGIYKTLTWVVSVMLPPMAIFFPLFTLLEDLGYLPRIAFNLDKQFRKCHACGKQALTMCMGFGCNAVGVVGARIIDSPRERMIAILTNNFVPCNGRFPTIISIITMFLVGFRSGLQYSFYNALILTGVILFGILMTFVSSYFLSKTVLKGVPSSFTLELPPYRKPQIGKVIVRSICDRTLFVLGRAIVVAAPAGLLIWILANTNLGGVSLLTTCSNFLDPFAKVIGLDGVILFAFILGFPANEIVIPIMIMTYLSTGVMTDMSDLVQLKDLLVSHGWTYITAICTILFSLLHWPCSTTCLTIKKETK
ncbi:MAG: ferrous iron transport protein B, partial [Firmicutes bacterium]|nr:ferrous iron transport protein B [Bacillota bacterium]